MEANCNIIDQIWEAKLGGHTRSNYGIKYAILAEHMWKQYIE